MQAAQLSLYKNSAKNADLVEKKINEVFGQKLATALDTRTIEVQKPNNMSLVGFISKVENIELDSTFRKKLIIDVNRESIIAGGDIVISPIVIARNNFTIRPLVLYILEDNFLKQLFINVSLLQEQEK